MLCCYYTVRFLKKLLLPNKNIKYIYISLFHLEQIFIPKLQINFADFPYTLYSKTLKSNFKGPVADFGINYKGKLNFLLKKNLLKFICFKNVNSLKSNHHYFKIPIILNLTFLIRHFKNYYRWHPIYFK